MEKWQFHGFQCFPYQDVCDINMQNKSKIDINVFAHP